MTEKLLIVIYCTKLFLKQTVLRQVVAEFVLFSHLRIEKFVHKMSSTPYFNNIVKPSLLFSKKWTSSHLRHLLYTLHNTLHLLLVLHENEYRSTFGLNVPF